MVRSARCSFSLGRTAKRPQPPSSAAIARALEKDRQSTAELLSVGSLVGVEERPVAIVEPEGDLLLEGDLEPAAGPQREQRIRLLGEVVGLGPEVRAAEPGVEERAERRAGHQAECP